MTTDMSPLEELQEDFRTFRTSGIHGLEKWPNKTICIAIHNNNDQTIKIYRNKFGGGGSRHAEEDVIEELKPVGETQLYINWSPCDYCSELFLDWLKEKGQNAKLKLTFAGLYYTERKTCEDDGCTHQMSPRERYMEQLARLSNEPNIEVKTFEEKDWEVLFQCLHKIFYRETYKWEYKNEGWQTSFIQEDMAMKKDYEDILYKF